MKSTDSESLHDYPPEAYALLSESEKDILVSRRNMIIREVIRSSIRDNKGLSFWKSDAGPGMFSRVSKNGI